MKTPSIESPRLEPGWSYTFTHALTRRPGASVVDGLRAVDRGAPDPRRFAADHQRYVEVLRQAGAKVEVLEPLEACPDAVFVEDTALCLPHGAVLLRPGAPSRRDEVEAIRPALARRFGGVTTLPGAGFVDGGDILTTERELLVGASARTDAEGIAGLRAAVEPWGYRVRAVSTPPGVLHLKTDCALLDAETILSTPRLAASGCFDGYRVLLTPDGEEAAANVIRFNDVVVAPAGSPRVADLLTRAGYVVVPVGNTEAAKVDGGMSCLSLRMRPLAASA